MLLRLALLVCAIGTILKVGAWSTFPTTVIGGVPFTVSDTSTSLTSVFLSSTSDCNSAVTSTLTMSSRSVTFPGVYNITTGYVCGSAGSSPVFSVTINLLSFTPIVAIQNTDTVLTFSSLTPSGATVKASQFTDCSGTGVSGGNGNLNSNLQITVNLAQIVFMCVTVTAVAQGGALVLVNAGQLYVTVAPGFSPISVVYSDLVTFQLSGSAPANAVVRISTSSDCSTAVATYTAGGFFGLVVTTTITISRGTYQFCVQVTTGIFVSAGTLTVLKYSATPSTVFQNQPTTFFLTGDSPLTTNTMIATDAGCLNRILGPVSAGSTGALTQTFTLTSLGTYYLCVQTVADNTKYIAATSIVVAPITGVAISPDPAVRGLLETLTIAPATTYTARISTVVGDCTSVFSTFTTSSGGVATFVMPTTGSTTTLSTVQICVLSSDGSAVYPIRTLTLRNFGLSYDALLVGTRNFTLDTSTAVGTTFTISSASDCSTTVGSAYIVADATRVVPVTVTSPGTYYVCIKSNSTTYFDVATVVFNAIPTFSPTTSLTKQPLSVTFSNTVAGAVVSIGSTCYSGILASGTAAGTSIIVGVTFPSNGLYAVCANYTNSAGKAQTFVLGTISVADMTSTPAYIATGVTSTLTFSVPGTSQTGPINSNFFFTTASTCDVVVTPTIRIASSVATFVATTPGTFLICAQTQNGTSGAPYVPAGTVHLIIPPAADFVESYGAVHNVPFHFNLSNPYTPSGWLIASSPLACNGSTVASGVFDSTTGITGSWITLTASTTDYSLCVKSPDNAGYIFSRAITVKKFTSRVTSLLSNVAPTIATTPTLPSASFFLSVDANCDVTKTFYAIATGVAVTAPAGTYTFCATGFVPSTWYSAASNNVSILVGFSAQMPSGIRGNVPFNMTVSSDNTGPVRVYLIAGTNKVCNLLTDTPVAGFTGASSTRVVVKVPPRTNVTICVISNDGTVAMSVGSVVPLSYTNPGEIVLGTPTNVASGTLTTGIVRLTTDQQCTLSVGSSLRAIVSGVVQNINIGSSDTSQTFLYWCEAPSLSQLVFTAMDTIGLLNPPPVDIQTPPPATAPPNTTFNPPNGNIDPGTPFNITVPASAGTNPFLSPFSNCSLSVNYTYGIFPAEGQAANYFVCVTSSQGTVYTTQYPTINVSNFQMSPTTALTWTQIQVAFWPTLSRFVATGGLGVYFARTSDCAKPVLGPVTTLVTPVLLTDPGRVWACYSPDGSGKNLVGVASMLLQAPPTANVYPGTYKSFPVCFDLLLVGGNATYSVVEGVDTTSAGPQTQRRVWLVKTTSANARQANGQLVTCTQSDAVTSVVVVTKNTSICITSTGSLDPTAMYGLCAPTPVSNVIVASGLQFPQITLTPSSLVVDARTAVTVNPNVSQASVAIAAQGTGCATKVARTFTTDSQGATTVDLSLTTAFVSPYMTPFIAATYDVCLLSTTTNTFYPIASVPISAPVHYTISNNFITTLVQTQVSLLQDLTFSAIKGFATLPDCSDVTNSTASVSPTSSPTVVVIYYSLNSNATRYLCAVAPVNNTLVAVSRVQFATPILQFPSTASACTSIPLAYASATDPRFLASDTVVALYNGACCTSSGLTSSNIVSTATKDTSLITVTVAAATLTQFTPQTTFEVCVVSSSLGFCGDIGTMTLNSAKCTSTSSPSTTEDPKNTLPPSALVGGAVPEAQSNTIVGISVLAAIFGLIVILAIILCCICSYRHRHRVIPEDAVVADDEVLPGDREWRDNFDELFKDNRARAPTVETLHSMLNVPMDMKLNICNEQSLAVQSLCRDEELDRNDILRSEAFVFERLRQAYIVEGQDAVAQTVLAERTTLMDNVVSFWEREYSTFFDVEEENRDVVKALEEESRLAIAQTEKMHWQFEMERYRDRLAMHHEQEKRWHSRKRRLMEKSSQMWAHLDPSSALATPQRNTTTVVQVSPPQQQQHEEVRQQWSTPAMVVEAPSTSAPPASTRRQVSGSGRALTPLENPSAAADHEAQPYVAPSRPSNPLRATSADAADARPNFHQRPVSRSQLGVSPIAAEYEDDRSESFPHQPAPESNAGSWRRREL